MNRILILLVVGLAVGVFFLLGVGKDQAPETPSAPTQTQQPTQPATTPPAQPEGQSTPVQPRQQSDSPAEYTADVVFTLRTNIGDGKLVFVGVGGDIDGEVNPTLNVASGAVVQLTLVNGDGALHDLTLPDFDVASDQIVGKGSSTTVVFRADKDGTFDYYCSVPGHRAAGMEGRLVVGQTSVAASTGTNIAADPAALPAPLNGRAPQTVRVDLETVELEAELADGTTYTYWTYNGQVPGPFLRVRVGDVVEVHMKNRANSAMIHSVDFHAVTGPGGGAVLTQTAPGQERMFTFKALNPGLFVYHCATPMVSQHISNGMYGMILVEPAGGLPAVDHEFYVMQGELYTLEALGKKGKLGFSVDKLLTEKPEYFVFNGSTKALTQTYPLRAKVGQTVRIFFGVGGPNYTSAFHLIGEIFDRVYNQASLSSPPLTDVQTTLVPPGGATMVEFSLEEPGRYILVDHALSRLERGLVGFLYAEGEDSDVFYEGPAQ